MGDKGGSVMLTNRKLPGVVDVLGPHCETFYGVAPEIVEAVRVAYVHGVWSYPEPPEAVRNAYAILFPTEKATLKNG